jgi:hypothetical protein
MTWYIERVRRKLLWFSGNLDLGWTDATRRAGHVLYRSFDGIFGFMYQKEI